MLQALSLNRGASQGSFVESPAESRFGGKRAMVRIPDDSAHRFPAVAREPIPYKMVPPSSREGDFGSTVIPRGIRNASSQLRSTRTHAFLFGNTFATRPRPAARSAGAGISQGRH